MNNNTTYTTRQPVIVTIASGYSNVAPTEHEGTFFGTTAKGNLMVRGMDFEGGLGTFSPEQVRPAAAPALVVGQPVVVTRMASGPSLVGIYTGDHDDVDTEDETVRIDHAMLVDEYGTLVRPIINSTGSCGVALSNIVTGPEAEGIISDYVFHKLQTACRRAEAAQREADDANADLDRWAKLDDRHAC